MFLSKCVYLYPGLVHGWCVGAWWLTSQRDVVMRPLSAMKMFTVGEVRYLTQSTGWSTSPCLFGKGGMAFASSIFPLGQPVLPLFLCGDVERVKLVSVSRFFQRWTWASSLMRATTWREPQRRRTEKNELQVWCAGYWGSTGLCSVFCDLVHW